MLRKRDAAHAARWFASVYGKLPGCLILFLYIGMISGCGTIHTVSPQIHVQSTATISPFRTTIQTFDGDFTLILAIAPNHAGTNAFTMRVVDRAGKPADHVEITLYTTMQDMAMGTDSVVLRADGAGQFSATSDVLSMGGHWAIGITIQTADHLVHKAGVSFVLPA